MYNIIRCLADIDVAKLTYAHEAAAEADAAAAAAVTAHTC
jgi:hypothetical protein